MILDYSVPPLSLTIGSFDATDYLDSISLSLPMHELGQVLTWTGRFTVNYNRAAIKAGLTEADFSPVTNPSIWRPAQQPVTLTIDGHDLPILRIERYAYNEQTQIGEGTFHQIIDAVATDRPTPRQTGIFSAGSPIDITWSVGGAVARLIDKAFEGATVNPAKVLGSQQGTIYDELLSRNPIADAQQLLASQWQWLTVDNTETIRTLSPIPTLQPSIFTRSLGQIEWIPDTDHINFAASKVIVTGSFQAKKRVNCGDEPLNPNLDRKARPKVQRTQEQQPLKEVFAGAGSTSLTPTTSEIKWIFYQYPDDLNWDSQLWQFIPPSILFDLQSDQPLEDAPIDSPCQTVTVRQQPAGRVFSDLGTNTNLLVAEVEIQSERRRGTWVPAGVLDPELGTNTTLTIQRYESLTTKPVILGSGNHGDIDPTTGKPRCLEPPPKKEERQPLAELPLETKTCKGTASVTPAGWSPIHPQERVIEVGFCPGDAQAAFLAQRFAAREQYRRDSYKVEMPIPNEWLAAGCPPLPRVSLHDGDFQADGLIINIADQKATFAFTAARISRSGVALFTQAEEITAGFKIRVISALALPYPITAGFKVGATTTIINGAFPVVAGFKIGALTEIEIPPEIPPQTVGFKVGAMSSLVPPAPDSLITAGFKVGAVHTFSAVANKVLDLISASASGAYSLRSLSDSYTGAVVRIRRSSDNTEQDFTAAAISAITTFTGGGDGFVVRLYDQSGNGRNVLQPTTSIQPRLVIGGVLQTKNGVPCIRQTPAQEMIIPRSTLPTGASNWTINYAAAMVAGGTKQRVLAAGTAVNWLLGYWNGTHRSVFFDGGTFDSTIAADDTAQVYTAIGQGASNALLYRNGTDFSSAGAAPSISPVTAFSDFFTNGTNYGEGSDSQILEIILFNSGISSDDRVIIENNQIAYFGV